MKWLATTILGLMAMLSSSARATTFELRCDIDVRIDDWHPLHQRHTFLLYQQYGWPLGITQGREELFQAQDQLVVRDERGEAFVSPKVLFADVFDPQRKRLSRKQLLWIDVAADLRGSGGFSSIRSSFPKTSQASWRALFSAGQPERLFDAADPGLRKRLHSVLMGSERSAEIDCALAGVSR